MSLKFLRVPFAVATIVISSLSFLPATGITQDYSICYMITSSGRIIDLNKLCQSQTLQKAKACQGPFDSDGFPTALYTELENFKLVLKKGTEQENESEQIYAEVDKILDFVDFPTETQALRQKLRLSNEQILEAKSADEFVKSYETYGSALDKLKTEPCYSQILQALGRKSLLPQIMLPSDIQQESM